MCCFFADDSIAVVTRVEYNIVVVNFDVREVRAESKGINTDFRDTLWQTNLFQIGASVESVLANLCDRFGDDDMFQFCTIDESSFFDGFCPHGDKAGAVFNLVVHGFAGFVHSFVLHYWFDTLFCWLIDAAKMLSIVEYILGETKGNVVKNPYLCSRFEGHETSGHATRDDKKSRSLASRSPVSNNRLNILIT